MHQQKTVRFSDEERNKYRSIRSVYSTYSAAATVSPSLYSGAATVPPSIYSADPTEIHNAFSTDESLYSAAQTVIFDMTDKGKDDNKEASDVVEKEKTSTTNMQSKIRDDIKRNIKNHESIAMAVGVEDDISSKISTTTDDISAAYGKQDCNPPLMRRISHVNYAALSLASIWDPRLTPASNSKCGSSSTQQRKVSSLSSGSTSTSSISSASNTSSRSRRVWKEVLDRNTFKTYYYSIQTKEVTWTRPADFSSTYESDAPSEVESTSTGSTLRRMNVLSAMRRFMRKFETPEETLPLDVKTVSILDEDSDRVEISPLHTPVVGEDLTKQKSGHPPIMNEDNAVSNEDLLKEDTNKEGSGQAKLLVKDDEVEHNEMSPVVGNELEPIETSVSLTGGEEDTVCLDILFTCDPFRTY